MNMAISITKRREFIHYIFEFFGKEETDNLVSTYDLALTTKYPVDWEAFYADVIKTTEKRALPMPKYFTEKIAQFKKITATVRQEDESIIKVILKNGQSYCFTVYNAGNCSSLKDIKRRYAKNKGGEIDLEIKKIIRYPKETTFVGDNIFFETNIPKSANLTEEERKRKIVEMEKELEKQIEVLYIAP